MTSASQSVRKERSDLSAEWDALADLRHEQITSGKDISFRHVLLPAILRLLDGTDLSRMLDVGSGTGELTQKVSEVVTGRLLGIEPSLRSVAIARQACASKSHVSFIEGTLEQVADRLQDRRFTGAVAAMTLMTVSDLPQFASSLATLLERNGSVVATITHPCFWPRYWGYEAEEWFRYESETFVEAPFRISYQTTPVSTTHVHRPLEMYISVFREAGFMLETLVEPMPSRVIEQMYPAPWDYPRFLGIRWRKLS